MFEKLKAKFKSLPRDKVLHFGMGAAAAFVTVFLVWVADKVGVPFAALSAAVIIGGAYEGVQWYRKEGTVEFKDALATAAGGAVAALVISVFLL